MRCWRPLVAEPDLLRLMDGEALVDGRIMSAPPGAIIEAEDVAAFAVSAEDTDVLQNLPGRSPDRLIERTWRIADL